MIKHYILNTCACVYCVGLKIVCLNFGLICSERGRKKCGEIYSWGFRGEWWRRNQGRFFSWGGGGAIVVFLQKCFYFSYLVKKVHLWMCTVQVIYSNKCVFKNIPPWLGRGSWRLWLTQYILHYKFNFITQEKNI